MARKLDISLLYVALFGVAGGAIILAIYHCIIVGWCSRPRPITGVRRTQAGVDETPSMEASRVELLPVQKYSKEAKTPGIDDGEEALCSVCLGELMEGEELRILPECVHSFHVECIEMWLSAHSNCPLCRTNTMPLQPQQPVVQPQRRDYEVVRMEGPAVLPDFGYALY